jgi:hypothetical protein
MGLAVETLAFRVANPGTTFTAVTMATGNSNVVRQFSQGSKAVLEHATRQGATSGAWRIISPVLHDNVTGITLITAETPSVLLLPDYVGEPMQPGDTLTIQGTGGTAETEVGSITIYYQDVLGLSAMLYNWADILPAVEHLKTFEVDCSVGGTAGIWADTLLNATDKQAKADRKYAILGWVTDTALAAIGFYGGETGNVRIGGPANTTPEESSHWFIQESERMGTPHIPVISANNFGSTNVSIVTTATSGTAKITVSCALLRAGF